MPYSIEQFRSGEIAVDIRNEADDIAFRELCREYCVPITSYTYSDAYKEEYTRGRNERYAAGIAYRRSIDEPWANHPDYKSDFCYIGWFENGRGRFVGEHIVEVELSDLQEYTVASLQFDATQFFDLIS